MSSLFSFSVLWPSTLVLMEDKDLKSLTHLHTQSLSSSSPPSFPLCHRVGAVALTHPHWQITFLMEFNYLLLPCGDLARKRPTAGAWGRTGQEGTGKEKGSHSFPPLARYWITSVLIWKCVIRGGNDGQWGKTTCRLRIRPKTADICHMHTLRKKNG